MVNRVLLRPGKPLDQITYAAIAGKGEITGLRIHDDVEAAESARSIDARAYTVGRHVVFGQGEYQPGSDRTNRLLAHELAHMQQQRLSRGDGAPLRVDLDRDGHWEREARSAAMADAPGYRSRSPPRPAGRRQPPLANAPVHGPTDAGVSSAVDAAPADPGLSQRKQALLGVGGTTYDMAVAMQETDHMSAAAYPYVDGKVDDSANFGI